MVGVCMCCCWWWLTLGKIWFVTCLVRISATTIAAAAAASVTHAVINHAADEQIDNINRCGVHTQHIHIRIYEYLRRALLV